MFIGNSQIILREMKFYYQNFTVLIFLWAKICMILLSNLQIYSCCILEERRALLDFKASVSVAKEKHPDDLVFRFSWVADDHSTGDCCIWEGVKCSNTTGRIVELKLPLLAQNISNLHVDYYYDWNWNWFLNSTTLLPLKNLQVLNLSLNGFRLHTSADCEGLADLKNLESLDLDGNYLGNGILHCIKAISGLKRLSLYDNGLVGSFPSQEISGMKELEHLDLSGNELSGSLPSEGIGNMKNLVHLRLSWNNFAGSIPSSVSNLKSLKLFDVSYNNLSGNIPPMLISNLVNLEYLALVGNHFEGSFSLRLISNHSKLQVLSLNRGLHVDFGGLALPSPFQLRILVIRDCNLQNESRQVLDFLFYQKELRFLDLSSNNLGGKFPDWLLENNIHLEFVEMRNNSFTGRFLSTDNGPKCQDLVFLDISDNGISGEIPRDIGMFFPNLKSLNLSRNFFEGSIPESLAYLSVAYSIDLSHNNLSGAVPDRIGTGCASLSYLYLSHNSLRGYFPSNSANFTRLRVLRLDNNHFSGSISHKLAQNVELNYLDASNNKLQGKIPSWMGDLPSLQVVDLSQNQLEGNIPEDICKLSSLEFLNLSENLFNGSIPSCTGLNKLKFFHLQGNQITGVIPKALLASLQDLRSLDLRRNGLSGVIPYEITTLVELRFLLLGRNNFRGQIPTFICRLNKLKILDLSHNEFSYEIPSCLNNISYGIDSDIFYEVWNTHQSSVNIISYRMDIIGLKGSRESQFTVSEMQEIVDFTTKNRVNTYAGDILNYMSGFDLSCNKLTGKIPSELGDLIKIRAINLSHNHLQGAIPSSFSMLKFIESLDLSYNSLSGQISDDLTNLHFISTFNASFNNFSGEVPKNRQFATFDESSYLGNPYLCGSLLQRHCESNTSRTNNYLYTIGVGDKDDEIDVVVFFWSFSIAFVAALATLVLSLYLSLQFQRTLSFWIDIWILPRFYRGYEHCRRKFHFS